MLKSKHQSSKRQAINRQKISQLCNLIFGICLVFAVCDFGIAKELSAQGVGDTLLKEGIGVRPLGMGGAYSAVANDASALFFNPAGLAEPGVSYTLGNLDTEQKNGDSSFRLLKLGFFGYGEAKISANNGDQLNLSAFGFGDRSGILNWGLNYKPQNWLVGGLADSGWTSDLGLLIRLTPQIKMGLVAQDVLTTKARLVPASGRIGLSYSPFAGHLIIAADAELYRSNQNFGHLGLEANLAKGLAIRAGLDRNQPTAGLSLDMGFLSFDYAFLSQADGKNIQRFEAGFEILPKKERPFSLIKPKEYALIDVGGAIKGGVTELSLFGGINPGLDSMLETIRAAAKDPGLDGILIRLKGFNGGLGATAIVQEMRTELLRAKVARKKIVAYIESSAVGDEYYLASVADKIVAAPGAAVGGFGKSIEIFRLPGLFEKFGIEWQVLTKGKYKSTFDWLSPSMSKEQKAELESLVDDLSRQLLTDISADRKIKLSKLKKLADGSFYTAKTAKKMGLVDQLGYLNDAAELAGKLSGGAEAAKMVEPRLFEPEDDFFTQVFGVAVIEIDGEIVSGYGGNNFLFGGSYVGSDKIVKDLRTASDDNLVKAIIIRINSPGGSPVAAGEIYQAIKYAKEKKKLVIASCGNIAASAGYYIASAADKIIADRSTITGSIGVIGSFPTFAELLKNFNIKVDVVKSGSQADMFSGLRKLTTSEVASLNLVLDETYKDFINAVATGRQLATKEVAAIAEGRVYTGTQALAIKLVDKLGGFMDAVDQAKESAEIIGEPRLIYYREVNPWLEIGQGAATSLGLGLLPWNLKASQVGSGFWR